MCHVPVLYFSNAIQKFIFQCKDFSPGWFLLHVIITELTNGSALLEKLHILISDIQITALQHYFYNCMQIDSNLLPFHSSVVSHYNHKNALLSSKVNGFEFFQHRMNSLPPSTYVIRDKISRIIQERGIVMILDNKKKFESQSSDKLSDYDLQPTRENKDGSLHNNNNNNNGNEISNPSNAYEKANIHLFESNDNELNQTMSGATKRSHLTENIDENKTSPVDIYKTYEKSMLLEMKDSEMFSMPSDQLNKMSNQEHCDTISNKLVEKVKSLKCVFSMTDSVNLPKSSSSSQHSSIINDVGSGNLTPKHMSQQISMSDSTDSPYGKLVIVTPSVTDSPVSEATMCSSPDQLLGTAVQRASTIGKSNIQISQKKMANNEVDILNLFPENSSRIGTNHIPCINGNMESLPKCLKELTIVQNELLATSVHCDHKSSLAGKICVPKVLLPNECFLKNALNGQFLSPDPITCPTISSNNASLNLDDNASNHSLSTIPNRWAINGNKSLFEKSSNYSENPFDLKDKFVWPESHSLSKNAKSIFSSKELFSTKSKHLGYHNPSNQSINPQKAQIVFQTAFPGRSTEAQEQRINTNSCVDLSAKSRIIYHPNLDVYDYIEEEEIQIATPEMFDHNSVINIQFPSTDRHCCTCGSQFIDNAEKVNVFSNNSMPNGNNKMNVDEYGCCPNSDFHFHLLNSYPNLGSKFKNRTEIHAENKLVSVVKPSTRHVKLVSVNSSDQTLNTQHVDSYFKADDAFSKPTKSTKKTSAFLRLGAIPVRDAVFYEEINACENFNSSVVNGSESKETALKINESVTHLQTTVFDYNSLDKNNTGIFSISTNEPASIMKSIFSDLHMESQIISPISEKRCQLSQFSQLHDSSNSKKKQVITSTLDDTASKVQNYSCVESSESTISTNSFHIAKMPSTVPCLLNIKSNSSDQICSEHIPNSTLNERYDKKKLWLVYSYNFIIIFMLTTKELIKTWSYVNP